MSAGAWALTGAALPALAEGAAPGARSVWLVVAAAAVGVLVVAPALSHAVLRWIGWRVVTPLLLGRLPGGAEVGRPRAGCGRCGRQLAPDRLPVLAFSARAGRCPECGAGARGWTGGVELATAAVFGGGAAAWGLSWPLVPVLVLAAGAVAISTVDLWVMRIPTRFVWVTGAVLALALVAATAADPAIPTAALAGAALGGMVLGGGLGVLHLASPRMLGLGDVRLGLVAGALLGWLGWSRADGLAGPLVLALQAALLAGIGGTVVGVVLLVVRRRNVPYPFGPALAVGAVVASWVAAVGA